MPPPTLDTQRSILAAFVAGRLPARIAADLNQNAAVVDAVLRMVGNDPARARKFLEIPAKTADTRPPGRPVDALEALLTAGEAHTQTRVRTLAHKAREALDVLQRVLDEETQAGQARRRIAQLEAELAALKAGLPASRVHNGAESKVIREWARANSIDVPDVGRLPALVVEAYRKATA